MLALGQQYSGPVPWLQGGWSRPNTLFLAIWGQRRQCNSKFKFITCLVHGLKITFLLYTYWEILTKKLWFEGGALSIKCHRILFLSFERAPRFTAVLISVRLKLRTALFRVYTVWLVFDCFITFVVNFHYMWGLYYICGQLIFEPTLSIFVFIEKNTLKACLGSNQIKFMTYQLGQRKEFPPLLIRLHQLLQPISKSRKSYLQDTTDFINYIF